MAFRVNFFLQQQGDRLGGWSENYWNSKTDLSACITAALALRTALMFAKGDQAVCPRYRISDPVVFRSGRTYIVGGASARVGNFPSDYQVTKLLLNFTSSITTTQQWFGGQTDASIVNGGYYDPSSSLGSLTAYANTLANGTNGWSVRSLNPAFPPIPVLSIDATTGTVTTGGHTYVTGDRIRISYVHGLTSANGLWRVIQIPSNTTQFNLAGWIASPLTPMLKSPNARVRLQSYTLSQITQVRIVRASNHRVGVPTGTFGGRRKRRKTG